MLSISSLAMAARWPPHSLASISTSLAMTSSFFWTSPCTFSLPALPSTSPSAPLLTEMAMRLQARATTSISRRSCGRDVAVLALLFDQVLGEADAFGQPRGLRAVQPRAAGDDLAHVGAQVGAWRPRA
jgi:hypothetical protein